MYDITKIKREGIRTKLKKSTKISECLRTRERKLGFDAYDVVFPIDLGIWRVWKERERFGHMI